MNRPFVEMSYNSSGPNITPERLLLATRRPSMHHPLASGAPSFDPLRTTRRRTTNHATHGTTSGGPRKPSAVVLRSIWRPLHSIRHLAACHPPASSPRDTRQPIASHPPSRRKPSAISLRAIRWHPAGNLLARTDALNDPQNKPSARAGAPNLRKNTFCVIVNCPLQIKPVFYFLFTSIASPTHRIRVKSSLLRLGRSCLALPFTHLGKDIT